MWAVVNFLNENTVESVPIKWIVHSSQECFWPPKTTSWKKIKDSIHNCLNPGSDWQIFKIRILGEYDNYSTALQKASKATLTTDLSSANEEYEPPKKQRKNRASPSSSSDESSQMSNEDNLPLQYPVLNVASSSTTSESRSAHTPKIITSGAKKAFSFNSAKQVTPTARKSLLDNFCKPDDAAKCSRNKVADNDEDTDFKRQILRQLFIIRNLIQQQSDTIDILLKRNVTENINNEFEPLTDYIKMFPIRTENELENFETFLKESDDNMKSVARYLARIGGNNVKEIVRRIMYHIFSNEIGILYSWEGAKKKKIFKNLSISNCIFNAVRSNARTSAAQDDETISQIKGWLVRSRDRLLQYEKKNQPGEQK